jgi:hypothetical protein
MCSLFDIELSPMSSLKLARINLIWEPSHNKGRFPSRSGGRRPVCSLGPRSCVLIFSRLAGTGFHAVYTADRFSCSILGEVDMALHPSDSPTRLSLSPWAHQSYPQPPLLDRILLNSCQVQLELCRASGAVSRLRL